MDWTKMPVLNQEHTRPYKNSFRIVKNQLGELFDLVSHVSWGLGDEDSRRNHVSFVATYVYTGSRTIEDLRLPTWGLRYLRKQVLRVRDQELVIQNNWRNKHQLELRCVLR
jgi:hypothetical protein